MTSSALGDTLPGPANLKLDLMLGLCAGPRYLGCALLLLGEPLHLWTHRLQAFEPEHAFPPTVVTRFLETHPHAAVAVAVDPEAPSPRSEANERLRAALEHRRKSVIEVTRPEMAEVLGLGAVTNGAIRGHVIDRYPVLATYFRAGCGYRTESERYWEDAILATAAALTVFCRTTRPDETT